MQDELIAIYNQAEIQRNPAQEVEQHQKEKILQEHLCCISDYEHYAPYMYLDASDIDELHLYHHKRFIEDHADKLDIKSRDCLKKHIKAHELAMQEKSAMAIGDSYGRDHY